MILHVLDYHRKKNGSKDDLECFPIQSYDLLLSLVSSLSNTQG